jgi:hypothetical protein
MVWAAILGHLGVALVEETACPWLGGLGGRQSIQGWEAGPDRRPHLRRASRLRVGTMKERRSQ